jgi:hypothetical protein
MTKVSEKSLELNIGAELLAMMRGPLGMRKAYLRGLTQREERQEGVDFFVHLNADTRLFAFQFKAPKGRSELEPYRYTLAREQREMLFNLAQIAAKGVFYVLPFYVSPTKLQRDVPSLLQDTWLLSLDQMSTALTFGPAYRTKTIRCQHGSAFVNPEYNLQNFGKVTKDNLGGIYADKFAGWYKENRIRSLSDARRSRRNPWLVRGLSLAIVAP